MGPKRKRRSMATVNSSAIEKTPTLNTTHESSTPLGGPCSSNVCTTDTCVVTDSTLDRTNPLQSCFEKEKQKTSEPSGASKMRVSCMEEGGVNMAETIECDSPLSEIKEEVVPIPVQEKKKNPTKKSRAAKKGAEEIKSFKANQTSKQAGKITIKKDNLENEEHENADLNEEVDQPDDVDMISKQARRTPPVNSSYLPLPWKGRLGYACLNTYLRYATPRVFASRTCRISSIIEHRHPLTHPSEPEHATRNRPDKSKPASIELGMRYVEELCLANVRDLSKMFRWNDKYGIKFMRLSSEMFPFAGHLEHGYTLAPFASESLAEAGRVIAELGHRVSTHPGQFTQLGSPRHSVISSAFRDLQYHDEMLSLLKLPEPQNSDAVMILHMGGVFGDKAATLNRFRENYKQLSSSIKRRLVLENDDVSWSVHDLLPICEELNIPLCLDFHHHNIIFSSHHVREGTQDIVSLFPRIKATWTRKSIRQKMHYSEPCPDAITAKQRRKHNHRPSTLPPCPNDMDLMIEAKDKEQAVFELMRTFRLPGWDTINNMIPYEREDENKIVAKRATKKIKRQKLSVNVKCGDEPAHHEHILTSRVPEIEVGMGGKQNRVYWPPGMEEWLRPRKRELNKKDQELDFCEDDET
ncbi:UV-damage endonuclease [Podosphaera aphanis]|nr:UV-damage endonuclease [Podosphaera aphanis]